MDPIPTILVSSTLVPRHSKKVFIQLDQFMYLGESFEAIPEDEAMSNVDAYLQQKVMEVELEFMYSNQVWKLVEASEWIKPIRRKWVHKRKRGVDRKVETSKARFLVKVYKLETWFRL